MKKNNFLELVSVETLNKVISESRSVSQVFNKLKMCKTGPQYVKFKQKIVELGIDISHFKQIFDQNRFQKRPTTDYLIKNSSTISTSWLKKRLIGENLLKNKCYICSNNGEWQGKKLSLQLDHINGVRDDNRLENLRILCPNCHSQTLTYAGKKHKRYYKCSKCYKSITKGARVCKSCHNKSQINTNPMLKTKIAWPPREKLEKLVWTKTFKEISKDLKCSPNSVINICKKLNISIPNCGYWVRIKAGWTHELAINPPVIIKKGKNLLTLSDLKQIKRLINEGLSYREIARKFNTSHTTISSIANGKAYNSPKTLKTMFRYEKDSELGYRAGYAPSADNFTNCNAKLTTSTIPLLKN